MVSDEVSSQAKGNKRLKFGLVICVILIIILSFSTFLFSIQAESFRTNTNKMVDEKNDLQDQLSDLQSQLDDVQDRYDSLEITYHDYIDSHRYSNLEYSSYVNEHLHTNEEYDEARFDFYYVKPEVQKFGVYDLDDELQGLSWSEPYGAGVFDCSEMSACLEWYLENRGWHTKVVVGDSPFGSEKHAWLLVETSDGKYMAVESTKIEVVWWNDPYYDGYWEYDRRFETIQHLIDYSESGYDWWEIGFCPLEY